MKSAYIIDREGYISESIAHLLMEQGYLVKIIDNEPELIKEMLMHKPDVLVINFGIYGDPLFDTAMANIGAKDKTKVIALTTNKKVNPFDKFDIYNKGVIVMPFDIGSFLQVL